MSITSRTNTHSLVLRGFTILEMVVSLAIISIISAVALFNYAKFNSDTALTNQAYETAIAAREAETYALNVKAAPFVGASTDPFDAEYGVFFDTSSDDYVLTFKKWDRASGDLKFTSDLASCPQKSSNGGCFEKRSLKRNVHISRICVSDSVSSLDDSSCTSVDSLHISFSRPYPSVYFTPNNGVTDLNKKAGVIELEASNTDKKMYLVILKSGQISVKDSI